jgi:polyisoprenoid-binding protein YceI
MSMEPGTYKLGPENGTLSVQTGRSGAASKAGHDLLIEVGAWGATVEIAVGLEASVLELEADSRSLTVREGTGGMKSLDDDDRANIAQTINEEVLKGTSIAFRSRTVRSSEDGRLSIEGDLELGASVNPVAFDLALDDGGHVKGSAVVKQSTWGMKPYSALFGTLKVADEVTVLIDGRLSPV